ncbi:RNA polymerase factor sigma-54 [Phaeovibrio sulfidiphilus]|uniref:RNA polymerase sigma-54 factor n=1 Tax=Phaeovibrio sulfidiphilus TaxID=1220600 RepID=A0A8J7CD28_9PROT|nr:RNA polymerase factor sigma-54 [Phaeovibrio sulfidiphilus]MBE1236604.1 RNA polymerase factor sigma-54 [Phaeovibrio sulfidiphilus]
MSMTPRLDLRQAPSLVMTPRLQQAIRLLQLSSADIIAYVEEEVERNPLLEHAAGDDTDPGDADTPDRFPDPETGFLDAYPGAATELPLDQDFNTHRDNDIAGAESWGHDDAGALAAGSALIWDSGHSGGDLPDTGLENHADHGDTLLDHLERQITLDIPEGPEQWIARQLLLHLDETGYLTASTADVAAALGLDVDAVDAVLKRLQAMDPPGLFARSLGECLALQLADRNRLDPAMEALLANLELLAAGDLDALGTLCGVQHDDLDDMIREIRTLDPKPALRFERLSIQTRIPDVYILPRGDDDWQVELNSAALPRVIVNNRYYATLSRSAPDPEVRAYLSESLASANWLARALDQRARTVLRVSSEIARRQSAFFSRGVRFLKPMTLRDVAEAVEIHESTVSRATANKTIACPRGLFEMKYFFTQAISGADGEALSAETVRDQLRSLVEAEPPDCPLSDEALVSALKSEGIDIARRTVAKYREALGIPSSVHRRKKNRGKPVRS